MDPKILFGTFLAVFLAEIGDKTQFAVFGATTASQKPLEVFVGAMLAFVVVTGLAVVLGRLSGNLIPAAALRVVGGVIFVVIGLTLLLRPHG